MGSIRKSPRSEGRTKDEVRWEARFRDPAGRQRTKTFARKADAQAFLAAVETDKRRGEYLAPERGRLRVEHWVDEWRATTVALEPKTKSWYESNLRAHVLPQFSGQPIATLDALAVKKWIAEMKQAGVGPRTIRGAVTTLGQVAKVAMAGGAIRVNPTAGVALPRIPKREMLYLAPQEIERLAQAIGEGNGRVRADGTGRCYPEFATLVRFAAYSGLRAGEIGALRVNDLNLLRRSVRVDEALKEVGGHLHFGPTKTHETRTVFIPRQLCDELAVVLAGRESTNDLVFSAPMGGPLRHNAFYKTFFKPAVVRAGLDPALRFHDLRHTCAALLIGQGHQQYEIMRHLGHSSIQVTIDTYGHLFPDRAATVADTLEGVWLAAL